MRSGYYSRQWKSEKINEVNVVYLRVKCLVTPSASFHTPMWCVDIRRVWPWTGISPKPRCFPQIPLKTQMSPLATSGLQLNQSSSSNRFSRDKVRPLRYNTPSFVMLQFFNTLEFLICRFLAQQKEEVTSNRTGEWVWVGPQASKSHWQNWKPDAYNVEMAPPHTHKEKPQMAHKTETTAKKSDHVWKSTLCYSE